LKNFDFTQVQTLFLGILPLSKPNIYVLPIMIAGLQFLQMKLSLAKNKLVAPGNGEKNPTMDSMRMMNNMMIYVLPVMIGFFAASMPAAVGLYWGTSTLFGIGQQLVINRK
jgi:YidC/Oxa1 family membrane protein insertase